MLQWVFSWRITNERYIFILAVMWGVFAWHDYGVSGANHDFWIDVILCLLCYSFTLITLKDET